MDPVATRNPHALTLLRHPVLLAAFGFGSGLSPRLPGTCGSLIGIPLFLVLSPSGPVVYMAVLVLLFLLGIYLCDAAARHLGVHDHSGIVWDEIVGLGVTLLPACNGVWGVALPGPTWGWLIAGFVLFRAFDIAKPGPIGVVDRRVGGGLGIMLDDLVAAVFAAAVLAILILAAIRLTG